MYEKIDGVNNCLKEWRKMRGSKKQYIHDYPAFVEWVRIHYGVEVRRVIGHGWHIVKIHDKELYTMFKLRYA